MAYQIAPFGKFRALDDSGNPLAGGKLYTYAAGTTTPQTSYAAASGGANANPVVLDANGEASVYLDPSLAYKFVLKTSADVTRWTEDDIRACATNCVSTDAIQASAVTTAKIADANVTRAKLADGAVAKRTVASKTVAYTATSSDDVILCDASGGNFTLTLPTAAGITGKVYWIGNKASTGVVTIDGSGAETIGGVATRKLAQLNDFMEIISDGTNWQILATNVKVFATYRTSASSTTLTFSTGTEARVDYDTAVIDPYSCVTTGASWVFTAPYAMRVYVTASARFSSTNAFVAGEGLELYAKKNGSSDKTLGYTSNFAGGTIAPSVRGTRTLSLAAGDTVSVFGLQASGSSINLDQSASYNQIDIVEV